MLRILSQIPSYYLFRRIGWPRKLPSNLTLSVSYRCNSRCKTCNIYKKKAVELTLQEWEKVFRSLGETPFWVTISGGEPFLRNDLPEVVRSLYDICRPSIINIPTNGILFDRIPDMVRGMAKHCEKAQVVVNLSIDEVEEKHDWIRGVNGNHEKVINTFQALRSLNLSNLSLGFHTVISKFNAPRIPQIYAHVREYHPDSFITEIAEERVELNNLNTAITPDYPDYAAAVDFLTGQLRSEPFNKVGKITRAFRMEYYRLVKRVLKEQRQIIPCYAGFSSAQIAPDGEVWMCCIKAEPIGSLREAGYDFGKIWFSEKAGRLRRGIKKGECHCPLANASYTNMLHHFGSLVKVGWNFLRLS